jgi:lipopolysaccharide/colanic/teichoic acid biosynthesis glycosyltransferase
MLDAKRLFDLAASGLACIVFAPVVPGLVLLVHLEDRLPPLFVQERIGRGRVPFRVWKLRTMRHGHVTRVGRWLRATGLDELAQFVNVFRGEMSVVGPRPLTAEDVSRLGWDAPAHDARFSVRPGIVGLAQALGGRTARHSARLERLYLDRVGLRLDTTLVAAGFVSNLIGKARMRGLFRRLGILGRTRRPLDTRRRPLGRRGPSCAPLDAQSAST